MRTNPFGAFTRRSLLSAAVAVVALGTVPALAQETVTLKTVTIFEPGSPLSKPIQLMKEVFERESKGRIVINILGGPEVIPAEQQFDGLKNGVVDILFASPPYYAGTVPEAFALLFTNLNGEEMRKSGLFELMREVHGKRAGVHYLSLSGGLPGSAFRFYFRDPIDTADFKGRKLRVSSTTSAAVEALGGTPVNIPYTETYTALERGVVDGLGSPYTGIVESKLDEVVRYVLQEPFYSLNGTILVNGKIWEGLPKEVKDELERIGPIYEKAIEEFNSKSMATEDAALKEHGVQFVKLSDEEAKKFHQTVDEVGWGKYMKMDPENGAKVRALAVK